MCVSLMQSGRANNGFRPNSWVSKSTSNSPWMIFRRSRKCLEVSHAATVSQRVGLCCVVSAKMFKEPPHANLGRRTRNHVPASSLAISDKTATSSRCRKVSNAIAIRISHLCCTLPPLKGCASGEGPRSTRQTASKTCRRMGTRRGRIRSPATKFALCETTARHPLHKSKPAAVRPKA